ncbi:MAG: hypothetical protein QXI12_12125 [Candidatus Methanomethyliaceae archaeon]
MNTIKIIGTATALAPITQGVPPAEQNGGRKNLLEQRKLTIMTSAGPVELPVISGNSIRGATRRIFIAQTLRALGIADQGTLDPMIAYFLLAGGTTDGGLSLNYEGFINETMTKLPFVELLGGSLHGAFFPSKMSVSFMIPLVGRVVELYQKLGGGIAEGINLDAFDLMEHIRNNPQRYTRKDDRGQETFAKINKLYDEINEAARKASATPENPEGFDGIKKATTKSGEEKDSAAMIYGLENIPPGTPMFHTFSLEPCRKETENAFWAFVDTFIRRGRVGGNFSKGYGWISVEYRFPNGEPIDREISEKAAAYWRWLEEEGKRGEEEDGIKKYLTETMPKKLKELMIEAAIENANAEKKKSEGKNKKNNGQKAE